jgi:uncharacterized sulfatase
VTCAFVAGGTAWAETIVDDSFETAAFTDANPAGPWVRGSADAFLENYAAGGGILNRAAADLGLRGVPLNPVPANAWIYRDTGQAYQPNTTYTVTLYAGSRQNTAYQGGGPIEFGLWSGVPAQPATAPPLPPVKAGGNLANTSIFPAQTMVPVVTYSHTTGADVSGMGNVVVFVRNLASGNGRSTIDAVKVESEGSLPDRPNILWLVAEDMSPTLGCYGDPIAITPRIDTLASEGLRFNKAWSNAPICSVARTTLITGTHAVRTGGTMHRSTQTLTAPGFMRFYPRLLQEAGYYTSNRSKEDYNIQPAAGEEWRKGWNDSSGTGHWRNRPAGQPFLAVFNFDDTHESRIRPVGGAYAYIPQVHSPANMVLPDSQPDIPKLRESWARHHDTITHMDGQVGAILDQLEADGLADDTIVFFYSDHGSCVPGFKRFVGNRGQRVPLIMRVPPKYAHLAPTGYTADGESEELVSFVDFASTLLSLLDIETPAWMDGRAFAGARNQSPPPALFGYVCRHDTRIANTRSAFDGRYVYIRNFQADTPHGSWSSYTTGIPTTNPPYATLGSGEWLLAFLQGGLTDREAHFFRNSGGEQLYDLETDPSETINLVDDPAYAGVLSTMRGHLSGWQNSVRDGGLVPEGRLYDLIAATGLRAWDVIASDTHVAYSDLVDTAWRASSSDPADVAVLVTRLTHPDATVRMWAARGLGYHGRYAVRAHQSALLTAASDSNYWVQVSAHQALAHHATEPTRGNSIDALFAFTQRTGVVTGGVTNQSIEREIHFAGEAISSLPYLDQSYFALTTTMNNETYATRAYRQQVFYWFNEEFNHPLAAFRATHGLDKTGSDDLENPSGDGVSNLVRYAFGMSPQDGDLLYPASPRVMPVDGTAGLPTVFRDPLDGAVKYQYVRRKVTSDPRVSYQRLKSDDLLEWLPDSTSGSDQSINTDWERVTVPVSGGAQEFRRVGVNR